MISLFWIVTFCLGLTIVSQEGKALYFLRKPFDSFGDKVNFYEDKLTIAKTSRISKSAIKYYNQLFNLYRLAYALGMPLITCITCMASIWGFVVFVTLNGLTMQLVPQLILTCVSASFIQTFIWDLYVRHIQ